MSDFDRVFLRKSDLDSSRGDDFDDNELEQHDEEPTPAAGREGLPPTFRMRADSHYVDLLTSRAVAPPVHLIAVKDIFGASPVGEGELGPLVESITSLGVVQPLIVRRRKGRYELIAGSKRLAAAIASGIAEVPCLVREADDERARALAEAENLRLEGDAVEEAAPAVAPGVPALAAREIIDSLATIESCLNLFLERDRPLRERVALSLVKAEAYRARWLAEAYSVLGTAPAVARRGLNPSILVGRALQGAEAEGRLSNVRLALAIDEPTRTLFADERLLSVALAGVAGAMIRLLRDAGEAVLKVRVSTHPATRQLGIQFAQDLVAAPEPWLRASAGSPGSAPDENRGEPLGLAAARRVMELHGGHLETTPGPRGGCTVALTLPAGD